MDPRSTPILLIGFNRPELLSRIIDRLREVQPAQVFLAVDGPRAHILEDADRVKDTQDCAAQLDWDCTVQTLFRDTNVGCGQAVSGAITWFFEHVVEGIIIEDDILPDPTFFSYSAELLDRYRDDERVIGISGSSYLPPDVAPTDHSYRFSIIPNIWGWATWRDRWERYRFDIAGWRQELPTSRLWQLTNRSPWAFAFWSAHFDLMARHQIDTWDLQWVAAAMRTHGVTATPNVNLVENIGWGEGSTHTQTVPDHLQPVQPMVFPLRHPEVRWDGRSDAWTNRHAYGATLVGTIRRVRRALAHGLHWRSRKDNR
jgi:hypothetical protein